MILEICVDSLESALTAARGGADRVELCSDLLEGGITPSAGLIAAVREHAPVELYVMIRPRGGDFVYSDSELKVMAADIQEALRLGADGVVLGVLTPQGNVDIARTCSLVESAAPMKVTFHRAIDMVIDAGRACEDIIATGAHRILTSGGRQTAPEGVDQIAELVRIGSQRIAIMAGSGVNASTAAWVAQATGVCEFHASLRKAVPSPVQHRNEKVAMGTHPGLEFVRYRLAEEDVAALRGALDALEPRTVS